MHPAAVIGIRSATVRYEMGLVSPGRQIDDVEARFVRCTAEIDKTDDVAMAYRGSMAVERTQCAPKETRVRIATRAGKRGEGL